MIRAKPPTDTQRLVLENMGYIRSRVAAHIRPINRWDLFDDVLQDAIAGACKAARTYREGAGAKFTTWANMEMDAAIHRSIRTTRSVISSPQISPSTYAYRDGQRGYREPMRPMSPDALTYVSGERRPEGAVFGAPPHAVQQLREAASVDGAAVVESIHAAEVLARAHAGIARRLPGRRDKSRRVGVFLRVMSGELQQDIAEELGVSRQTISAMVARVQPAFDAWAAEIRSEAA